MGVTCILKKSPSSDVKTLLQFLLIKLDICARKVSVWWHSNSQSPQSGPIFLVGVDIQMSISSKVPKVFYGGSFNVGQLYTASQDSFFL